MNLLRRLVPSLLAAALPAQIPVPLHQQADIPFLYRRRLELEQLATARLSADLLDMMRELPDLYSGGRPSPDVKTCGEALAEARARLLHVARDADARVRESLFLFAYPELADPDVHAALSLTVKELWGVAPAGAAQVRFRLRDAAGAICAELPFPLAVGLEELASFRVHVQIPLAGLADGRYTGEARVTIGGRPPRASDPLPCGTLVVRRGAQARLQTLARARAQLDATADAARRGSVELASLDAVLAELQRAVDLGQPYCFATALDLELAEAERRLQCLQEGLPMFVGQHGVLRLGVRGDGNQVFPFLVFVPATRPGQELPVAVLVPEAGGHEEAFFALHGRGDLLTRAEAAGVLLVATRSLSLAPMPDVMPRVLAAVRSAFPAARGKVTGFGHGAGAAQLVFDARRDPARYQRLFLLGMGWLAKDNVQALPDTELRVVLSSLSPHQEAWAGLPEMLAQSGHKAASVEVADGIPLALLPGRWLARLFEAR